MIKIETIYAVGDEKLQEALNEIKGRIISIEPQRDYFYKIIYEINQTPTSLN